MVWSLNWVSLRLVCPVTIASLCRQYSGRLGLLEAASIGQLFYVTGCFALALVSAFTPPSPDGQWRGGLVSVMIQRIPLYPRL